MNHYGEGPFRCPDAPGSGTKYGWIIAVVIVGVVALVIVAAILAVRSEWLVDILHKF